MKRTPTTSVSKLLSLFTILEKNGIDVNAFLLAAPDKRVPLETVSALNQRASDLTGDAFIGLHQGEFFTTGLSNILGYVLMNCRDVAEALEKFSKYQQIVDDGRILRCHVVDEQVILQYRMADHYPHDDRHLIDHQIMGMLTYSRILTGREIQCQEVHFIHTAPHDTSEYERLFNCKPHFGSPMNALIFDMAYLSLPILQPNRDLLVVLEGYAQEVLSRLQADDSHANKVKRVIVNVLRGESPTIGMIASRVNMSVRNLQLKLKEEGTSYSALLSEGRKELAQAYLKDRDVPIDEIAYLLGFSESSVFHRTFKRWTGTTPGIYRRQEMDTNRAVYGIRG
jgi:AraC-like DNA-binding protein